MTRRSNRSCERKSSCRLFPRGTGENAEGTSNRDKSVRPWQTGTSLVFVAFALASCASWQAKYLREVANQATMREVENHLGRPHSTWVLHTGETLWTYQSGVPSAGHTGGVTIVGPGWVVGRPSDCTEYVLLFDQQKILRVWMGQPCKPGRPVAWNGG
jgi:hypothetical protein